MFTKEFAKGLKTTVIEHREFRRVIDQVLAKVQYDFSTGFGLVVGVAGVGKTTAMRRLQKILVDHLETHPDINMSPPIALTMVSPEKQVFSWPDFYRTSLSKNLQDPCPEKRKNFEAMMKTYIREGVRKRIRAGTIADLRRAFVETANYRRCIALFIDEVQAMCKVSRSERAHDNLDVLKSLSDLIEVPVIGFGTSKAYEMLYVNEQICRRADTIHFGRYAASNEDVAEFRDVLYHIENSLKIPLSTSVSGDVSYFYEHTLGCVGILMDWLKRSIAVAIKHNSRKLSKDILNAKRLGNNQLASLAAKIQEAKELHDRCADFDAYKALDEDSMLFKSIAPKTTKPTAQAPGSRKPSLDPGGQLREELSTELL